MSLVALWRSSRDQLVGKRLDQVLAFTADGVLRDGNGTSTEFRHFLAEIPADMLARYSTDCLEGRFHDSGFALQDVVNEAGRRLGFQAEDGRYRGVGGDIGFDGIWRSSHGSEIVVEVKTTDSFSIDLDSVANYRRDLIRANRVSEENSSILLVVGRDDTGHLEAQIRGSRHAWDIRLLSVDALFRLVSIRENVEGPGTARRIWDVLIPREFTRVDGIIDLVFETATEAQGDEVSLEEDLVAPASGPTATPRPRSAESKPKFTPVNFHTECANRVARHLGIPLVKRSMATFSSPDSQTMVICSISREHPGTGSGSFYWFAFHPHQRAALKESPKAYIAFGCGSAERTLLIPAATFDPWVDGMNVTKKPDRTYWHVHIFRDSSRYTLHRRADSDKVELTQFLLLERYPDAPSR